MHDGGNEGGGVLREVYGLRILIGTRYGFLSMLASKEDPIPRLRYSASYYCTADKIGLSINPSSLFSIDL